MNLYDWLLFLHVAGAFAIVATLVLYGAVLAGAPGEVRGRLSVLGSILFNAGGALTIIFGVWLAIYVDGYELWDGWILAALVLWFVAAEVGRRLGLSLGGEVGVTAAGRAGLLYVLLSVITLAFLLLMIFKPGA